MQPSPTSGGPAAATYRGAGGTLLRTRGWSVLLDVATGDPLVERCWEGLHATSDPDELLGALGALVGVAYAVVRETVVRRVVARGAVVLVLDGTDVLVDDPAGGSLDLSLSDVGTVEVALATGAADGPSLPLRDGAVAAASVHLVLEPAGAGAGAGGAGGARSADDTRLFDETLTRATDEVATATVRVRRPTVAGAAADAQAPRVLAAVCPAGHLTPAYAGRCRVCQRTVEPQEAFETARPALGRLVLPDGDALLLDRGAVLGRAPYVPADWAGTRPHLVTLPDPEHDVSAQHVAVVLDLWNVLVCDLGSTNGTGLVDRAGRVRQLRPYEHAALGPGGAVVLADVVTVTFEIQP